MEDTEKKYELRPLVASDMGAVCKIISAIGIRQFKECFKVDDIKGKKVDDVGYEVVFDIAGIVISNIPKAQKDIDTFLASVTGTSTKEIQEMPFADYGELVMQVVTKEEFQDFFKRVVKLFNR